MWDCVAMLVREKDPIGPSNVRASAVTAPSTAANSDLARPRNVAFGSRAAVLARLMGRPVCPQPGIAAIMDLTAQNDSSEDAARQAGADDGLARNAPLIKEMTAGESPR